MNKGQFMQLVYTKDELRNIDSGLPVEIYSQPGFNTFNHIMNYNEPTPYGKLENMFEIAEKRGIEVPIPITPEEMTVIINIQSMKRIITGERPALWTFRDKSIDQLRDEQENLIQLYNQKLQEEEDRFEADHYNDDFPYYDPADQSQDEYDGKL